MKIRTQLFLLGLALPVVLVAQVNQPSRSAPIVFTHVTVIDATGAPAQQDMTVVISGNRITEIGKKINVPKEAKVVDATGKYMIPGLWDMHIHIHRYDENALLLANGVTGVRLMNGVPEYHKMRKEIENGDLLGPRYSIASRIMDGVDPTGTKPPPPEDNDAAGLAKEWKQIEGGMAPLAFQVETAAQAEYAISRSKAEGADFIKIHDDLTRNGYFNLVNASKKAGFIFVGHLPTGVSATEASEAGQKSIEHLMGILLGNSSREDELRKESLEAMKQTGQERANRLYEIEREEVDSYSPDKANALIAEFVKNHTWQCPTILPEGGLKQELTEHADLLKYLPASMSAQWRAQAAKVAAPSASVMEVAHRAHEELRKEVAMMQHAGVGILAGEDVGRPGLWAGFSLHDDLVEESAAGLTPMEVLQTATINPARFFGKEKEMGTVQKGKLADLVLLDANPLQDIYNTTKINAVVINGRLLDRRELDKMLNDVIATNAEK